MTDVCKSLRAVTSNITRRQKTKGNKLMYEKGEKKKKKNNRCKKKEKHDKIPLEFVTLSQDLSSNIN
jgi:hypothetical protein